MKKILIALAIAGFTYSSAEAQVPKIACEAPKGKVCRKTDGKISCYKTKYAEDFKVCKGEYGYYVCCETPNMTNSTHPKLNMASENKYPSNPMDMPDETYTNANMNVNMTAPQSQSYPEYTMNSATSYEGYYSSKKHYIKVCYGGDNVAELNRAPYNGCPTPAYDGPEVNRERNVNVSTPDANAPQADITGRSK